MDSLKCKFTDWMKYMQDKILPDSIRSYHFVEHHKKLFYYSKFSIDVDEFYQIYKFTERIKSNIFGAFFDKFKLCTKELLTWEDSTLPEKDKIMTLYSACFFHYYHMFSYETNNTFADYFNVGFLTLCEQFKFSVKKISEFERFMFEFYTQIQREIKELNYNKIKRFYKYYNSYIVKYDIDKEGDVIKKKSQIENGAVEAFQKNFLTHLVSAKERMVDLVFEIKAKTNLEKYPKEISFITSSFEKFNNKLKENMTLKRKTSSPKNNNNSDDSCNSSNSSIESGNCDNNSNNSNNSGNNYSLYSERVLCELVKCEIDDETKCTVNAISETINKDYLDKVLNCDIENKSVTIVNQFVCYVVEFNSEMIKMIPCYNTLTTDINIRFIVPAKELYNLVLEIYFSICDLNFTSIDTFFQVALKKGVQMKYACSLYAFFKKLMKLMLSEDDVEDHIMEVFHKWYMFQYEQWEQTIQQNGKEFTSFCECK